MRIGNLKEGAAAATASPADLLAAAALVIGETGGLDPEQRAQLFGARPALDPAAVMGRYDGVPLIAFRLAVCQGAVEEKRNPSFS